MGSNAKMSSNLQIIFTAVLSSLVTLGVGYLGYKSKHVESDIKGKEIAFEQTKLAAEQQNRDNETLKTIIPKIVSKDEQQVKEGMATLFALFQSRSKDYLQAVNSALTEQQQAALKDQLQPALQRAQKLGALNDAWIIVVGGDKTIKDAEYEVERAKRAGHSPILYRKQNWYRTTVGPFPTQNDAEQANIAVRATLRNGAYVVNLKNWCAKQSPEADYVECLEQ